jgi:hypothetical protein
VKPGGHFAIITPYYKESRDLLERCLQSVARQSVRADHIVVSDGFPQPWLDTEPVRHIKLDRAHGDFGNTPRGVGSLLAIAEGYDGIGFLDADNWLEPDHVETCIRTRATAERDSGIEADFVIARRHLRRPDGTVLPVPDENPSEHVDTSCFFMLPNSFHVIPHFAAMPKQFSPMGDRIFYGAVKAHGLNGVVAPHKTVNYHCLYKFDYLRAGETPPVGARPNVDEAAIHAWLDTLSERDLLRISNLTGVSIKRVAGPKTA